MRKGRIITLKRFGSSKGGSVDEAGVYEIRIEIDPPDSIRPVELMSRDW